MIKIRFATPEDKTSIIKYLAKKWNKDSPLVKSSALFDFQYGRNGQCNFVIAVDDETNNICGLKGFFYFNNKKNPDVAAALAAVDQGIRPMLGMEIQHFLEKETNARWVCSTGLNPNTSVRVYRLFKNRYTVDKLNHYYRLNDKIDYKIAKIENHTTLPVSASEYTLLPFEKMLDLDKYYDLENNEGSVPYKDRSYLEYRYFNHPVYQYKIFGLIKNEEKSKLVIIGRESKHNGNKAFRIVDILGDHQYLIHAGHALNDYLKSNQIEYIDFYCYGISEDIMNRAGFIKKEDNDANIIPNYFEPYVQKNVDIYFFYTGKENRVVCKADGDQDRPNFVF